MIRSITVFRSKVAHFDWCLLPSSCSQLCILQLLFRYYDFDASIFREFLGRMLSSKLRRDLDDLSNSYNLPLVR